MQILKLRIYSLIFLGSLFTGLIQPVLPLIGYYTFQESIIELFCVNKDVPEMECDGFCYLKGQIEQQQNDAAKSPVNLLNLDDLPLLTVPVTAESALLYPDRISANTPPSAFLTSLPAPGVFHPPQA
jgi:hypothetical protein